MNGIVTEIQRFSLSDGPGIRSTVFLKGCNMACQWCHNPETINPNPQPAFYPENCIGCRKCEESMDLCFADARVMIGKEMTANEVFDQIIRDMPYYLNSGGGVTLSGGEVLMQVDFALEILRLCKDKGINTVIESNFYASWEDIKKLLDYIDLIIVDMKHANNKTHRRYTGVSNELILENIKKIDCYGKPFIIRTPVVPNVNDNEHDIGEIGCFLSKLKNLMYYELLNFNPLGEYKYKGLQIENAFENIRPLSDEKIEYLAVAARNHGIKVRCG